ncbi:MAG: hypothetical protein ACTTJE_00575 [Schwartzia sp. (in: firmicutes)]
MIGTRLNKPIEDFASYTKLAKWCQSNGAIIADKGEYYECVREPEPMQPAESQEPHIDPEKLDMMEAMVGFEARLSALEAAKGGEGK